MVLKKCALGMAVKKAVRLVSELPFVRGGGQMNQWCTPFQNRPSCVGIPDSF